MNEEMEGNLVKSIYKETIFTSHRKCEYQQSASFFRRVDLPENILPRRNALIDTSGNEGALGNGWIWCYSC